MYIELQRTFRELLRNEEQGDNAGALSPGTSKLTLPDLLNEFRVIILSEAGSGKTEEIRESARRLRAEGKAAFFLRLEHVFFDFDTAFEEGTLEEFEAWLTSSEQGWVLLDSIDESRIRSPQDFAVAMRKVSARLATAKQRTHLLITGRTPAWRPKSDLDLCSLLFPVATWPTGAPDEDAGMAGEHKKTISVTGTTPFKIVALDDLSTQQVKHFAEEKGVGDTQLFLDAIERADAWSFTARPQDLDELTGFWLDNGTIGSRLELMTNSISRRLKEPDQTRAEVLSLLAERALEGAQIIAATLMLTNQQTIQIPDGAKGFQGLKLDALLVGWVDKDISTLLQRPLFTPDLYGTVRFHHRSVKEYLAAQWFHNLLNQEVSRRKVEDLFIREQYGLEVVVGSLRPLLPWLAMFDDRILTKVRRIAPEIVFEGGDPVQLPAEVRRSMLQQICDQLASGASTRLMADFAAIQRFAAPDLTDTLCRLIEKYQSNDDIVFFLMGMVWQGRLKGALGNVMEIARSPSTGYASRIAGFRAIADLGTPQEMESIRKGFSEEGDVLNRKCMADLVSHVQHPDEQTLQWLMTCIPRLAEYTEYEGTGLSEETAAFFERAPLEDIDQGLELLLELLTSPPVIERRYCEISQRYQWLRQAAGVAVRRLIEARAASALMPNSLTILYLLSVGLYFNDGSFNVKKLGLAELVQQWSNLKWALFWHAVELERQSRATKGERLTDPWTALGNATFVSFNGNDFDSALRAISERMLTDDKLVALSLTFNLYVQTGRERSRSAQLRKVVGDHVLLKERLVELMKPPRKSDELKQMERENARWSRKAAARNEKEAKARLEAPGKLEAQLDKLRDPGFDNPSAVSHPQYYLYNRMRDLEKDSSQWSSCNWRALEHEFGPRTPKAFRDGLVHFWRRHAPELRSEGAPPNSTPFADIFGLAGLTIESEDTPDLFWTLSPVEAAIAFRYAMAELNGFPHWFATLSQAHIGVVRAMVLKEIIFELQGDQEDALSHYIISDLSRVADWLWDTIAPDVVRLLRTHPPKSINRLTHLLDIVHASTLSDATIAALAAEKIASVSDPKHLALWMATWTGVDPSSAIDALEAHLTILGDDEARTEFTVGYVTHLLGTRSMSSRARNSFHSPAVLTRLYLLVHEHVRYCEDIDRANQGAYSPSLRDNAQDARERLVGILSEISGRDAYLALKVISESHPEPGMRPWFALRARSKAETDSERPSWSAEQVRQFSMKYERTPANHRELFDLAVQRLLDFKHELEDGDASTASVLINAEKETILRNYIAVWCNNCSQNRYFVPQEEELPDAKRPDLRWHCIGFKGPVPTELKIADNWTGPQLFERLEGQLAGDYLRDDASSRGIYLLVNRGTQTHWQLPSGEMGTFEQLVSALQGHWVSVATAHPRVEEIKVIGIDLTKRAKTPLPKTRPRARSVTGNTKLTNIATSEKMSTNPKTVTRSDSSGPISAEIPEKGTATNSSEKPHKTVTAKRRRFG